MVSFYCRLTKHPSLTWVKQDSLRHRRRAVPASLNMKNTERRYPPRNVIVERPVSEATDFFDTEFEMSDSEDESPRMSMDSVCLFLPLFSTTYC